MHKINKLASIKPTMMNQLIPRVIVLFCFTFSLQVSAQEFRIGVLPLSTPTLKEYQKMNPGGNFLSLKSSYNQDYNVLKSAQSSIVKAFLADSRFEVIDRTNIEFVDDELDRQKSESYIDGYVVEQGKQLGVEYLTRSFYNWKDKILTIRIFSIENGTTLSEKTVKFKRNLLGSTSFNEDVQKAVEESIIDVWPFEIILYESLDGNDKEIKKALAVSMTEVNLEEKDKLLMYVTEEKIVAGKAMKRDKVIGEAEVEIQENENFYQVKIKKGKKEAKKAMDSGQSVKFKIK